jgi:Di-haem oxidoreductase, putative peroxidase
MQGTYNEKGDRWVERILSLRFVRGRRVFQRKFTVAQGYGPRLNDGVGDIQTTPALGAGLADSCAGCHSRPRGSAGAGDDVQTRATRAGRQFVEAIGCTQCLIPDLPLAHDRRVADVETTYNPTQGAFNNLFATATPLHREFDDGSGFPPLKLPLRQPFLVRNIFADFKRHDLGPNFHERNFDGTDTTHFMTAPLWGVGSTSPYGHDGRSINLEEVILRHGGEAQPSRDAFAQLSEDMRAAVLRFLESLVLFPPDDTASNLDPASISLGVLFNNVNDLE